MSNLAPIYLTLPKENIAYLKFVLESYPTLATLRTLHSERGEVAVLASADTAPTVRELLDSIAHETHHFEIPAPDSITEDWLLRDFGN